MPAPVLAALPAGTNFTRYAICLGRNNGAVASAARDAEVLYPSTPLVPVALKSAIAAGAPYDEGFSSLVPTGLAADWIEALRGRTFIDRLAPFARRVPFNTGIPRALSGAGSSWIGAGMPIPVSSLAYDRVTLGPFKSSVIVPTSSELLKVANRAAETEIRRSMLQGAAEHHDRSFIDPRVAPVENVSPGAITFDATEVTQSGANGDAMLHDFAAMVSAMQTNLTAPFWIMSVKDAVKIATAQMNAGGLAFPTVNAQGGTLLGIPVLTSSNVPSDAGSPAGDRFVVLLDAAELLLADDQRASVTVAKQADLEMLDNPTNSSATPTHTTMTSLFQTSSVAFKLVREINWQIARAGAVVYMQVSY